MNRAQKLLFIALGFALMTAPLARAADSKTAAGGTALPEQTAGAKRANYSFRATPIEEVFDMLSRQGKVNIIVTRGVTGTVTLNLYDVSVRQAIYSIAQAAGYWVEVRSGDYVVLGKETSLDYPGTNTVLETLKVQYSDPKQVADILAKYVSRNGKVTPLIGRKMVVVEDLPSYVARVKELLAQIDVVPRQIMIEAKILEVGLDEAERFGIDWKKIFGSPDDIQGSIGTSGLAFGNAAAPSQGFFFSLVGKNLTAYLDALASKGRIRTLSTPKLLAMENQEAKAVIGDSTGYKVTTTINLVTTETVQFLESGVILRVTPSIDQQGRILLKVHPEVSSATLAGGIPSKKSTEVTTEMVCEDGQSIFIGGLIKARSARERNGVPLLGDLPVVGNLFSNSIESTSSTETVVIITPHIIREPRDAERFSADKVMQTEQASGLIYEHELHLRNRAPTLPAEDVPAKPPSRAVGSPGSPHAKGLPALSSAADSPWPTSAGD